MFEMTHRYIGADGCRAGWFCVHLTLGVPHGRLHRDIASLLASMAAGDVCLIDIPIGLKRTAEGPRQCDLLARQRLGRRAASVFNAPGRELLEMGDYAAANALSRQLSGKGLSKQTWNLCAKIREVDSLLQKSAQARASLQETHPELCFLRLAREVPLQHAKRTSAGFTERLSLLQQHISGAEDFVDDMLVQYPRAQVARDDILDAMACAVTAVMHPAWQYLPEKKEHDSTGLAMNIVSPDISQQAHDSEGRPGAGPGRRVNGQSAD